MGETDAMAAPTPTTDPAEQKLPGLAGIWIGVACIVVGVVVLVNQLEGNFLQPVVMGRTLKLHPLAILLALTAGTVLGGLAGTLLAVPIVAAAWAAVVVWDGPDTPAWFARKKRPEPS